MGSRQGGRVASVKVTGVAELEAFLRDQIAREDLNPAKGQLRQGTKTIANDYLIPELKATAASSGVPIAPAMAATARTRTDRLVVVTIGRVNPKLSGFKSAVGIAKAEKQGRKRHSQSMRTSLAWGSDLGPHPSNPGNPYGVPRNEQGYWVRATIARPDVFQTVKEKYQELLGQILNDYGRYR